MKVVIINGSGTHGKDEFISQFNNIETRRVVNFSTITAPKLAAHVLGIDPDNKTDAARNLWSDIKDSWCKHFDGSFKETMSIIEKYNTEGVSVLFIHCREPVEIQKIVTSSSVPTYTLFINRTGHSIPFCQKDDQSFILQHIYDFTISIAEGVEHSKKAAAAFYWWLEKK